VTIVGRPSSRRTTGGGTSPSSSDGTAQPNLFPRAGRWLTRRVHSASFSLHFWHGNPPMKQRACQERRSRRDDSNVPSHLILRLVQREHAHGVIVVGVAVTHTALFSLHLRHGYPSTYEMVHPSESDIATRQQRRTFAFDLVHLAARASTRRHPSVESASADAGAVVELLALVLLRALGAVVLLRGNMDVRRLITIFHVWVCLGHSRTENTAGA
jgi:hypothetical protein